MSAVFTYDEAIELAARLYRGQGLAEMALRGDLGMSRVPQADQPATVAMIAEIRAAQLGVQALTRKGRAPVANPLGLH
jgi:hypothetical protein